MSKSQDSDASAEGAAERDLPDIPVPPALDAHGPARIISMVNQKGGVGKTTSTVSLGAALADYGRRVLLVDFDPQGALSVALGYNPNDMELTVYNLITDATCELGDVLVPTDVPGMDLLPSNIDLSAAEIQLVSEVGREYALQRSLASVVDDYDVILIDCQPSLGLLTVNALTASTDVIIPMETEYFALRGVALLTDTINKVMGRLNPDLRILGVLATMYDPRTLHSREVLETVTKAFGDQVFTTVINRTVKFPDAAVAGEPITSFASSSSGAKAYRRLAREVLAR
ncbi:MAG TPA: ParA family protein [Candidatus Nanopelagicales bacterium]|nr:ParA family protein [Candidatus Nanopelagicales bacterium]